MSNIRFLTVPLAAALLLAIAGCSSKDNEASTDQPEADAATATGQATEGSDAKPAEAGGAEPVIMDEAALKAAGITLQGLQPSMLSEELRAPGEVIDSAYGTTLITPRVEALVVRRHAKLGDEVKAGAPLVTLSSVDVANAQADLRIAEQEWRRVSTLGREAVSGRRIAEAQVAVERARAISRAYGLPGKGGNRANGEFTLAAPYAGRLTYDAFVVGERIAPGTPLFRLVNESVVWVDAKLPPGTASRIEPGSEATVVVNGERITGKVQRSAHRTSEATRNASIRVEVPNKEDLLHGGDFVDVFFEAGQKNSLASPSDAQLMVPTDAVVQLEGETVVFRRNAAGALEPVPVRLGDVVGDQTVVREGLKSGDTIVVAGAFAVKSQILKAMLGEGDAH